MIKNLILDIGNVICEWNPERLSSMAAESPADQAAVFETTIKHPDWLALDQGLLSVDEAVANATARSDLPADMIAAVYEYLPASLIPVEPTIEAMNRAADAEVPMYILSNMAEHSWDYLQATMDCFSLCKGIVVSWEAKLIKPDAAIYTHLTDKFGLVPSECIFVDDMSANIDAAKACGWNGEQLNDPQDGGKLIDDIIKRIKP